VPGPNIPPAKQDPNQGPGGPIGPGK
jgi:hypothetical protein